MTAVADEMWWAPRRPGEATAGYLARVLDDLGARDLARNARACHYDDFRCPDHIDDAMNIHRLIADVQGWAVANSYPRRARTVMAAAVNGEFDSTAAEAQAWARSPEGRSVWQELIGKRSQGGTR